MHRTGIGAMTNRYVFAGLARSINDGESLRKGQDVDHVGGHKKGQSIGVLRPTGCPQNFNGSVGILLYDYTAGNRRFAINCRYIKKRQGSSIRRLYP